MKIPARLLSIPLLLWLLACGNAGQAANFGDTVSQLIHDFPEEFGDPTDGIFYASCAMEDPALTGNLVDAFLVFPQGESRIKKTLKRDEKAFLFWAMHDSDGYIFVNVGFVTAYKDDLTLDPGQGGLGTEEAMRRMAVPLSRGNLKLTYSAAEVFKRPKAPCRLAPARPGR
jgi:hypothetical protein